MEDLDMPDSSSRTTGNDPVEGLDPGGTRSTRPGKRKDGAPPTVEQKVQSGDENDDPQRQPTPDC